MPQRVQARPNPRWGPAEVVEGAIGVLLVDDDSELCERMRGFFGARGIRLEVANDGRRGLSRALGGGHELVLLDVMTPGLDGLEVLRLIRRQSAIPVIMLSSLTSHADPVVGLDAGADDFLPKPFGPEELLARIHAVLRRTGRAPRMPAGLAAGGIELTPSARQARCGGAALDLTTVEYDILEFLVRAAGRTVTRDEMTAAIYRRRVLPFDRALDVHISNLRKKLGPHSSLIGTVRGVGYLFRSGPVAQPAL